MTPNKHTTITRDQLMTLLGACICKESSISKSKREVLMNEALRLGCDDATAAILSSKVLKLWNALEIVLDKLIESKKDI